MMTGGTDHKPAHCLECGTRSRCLMAAVPDSELGPIGQQVRERKVKKGAIVAVQGDAPDIVRVLKVGQIVTTQSFEGMQASLMIMERGAPVGLTCLFDLPLGFGATTLTPARICEIPIGPLRDLPSWTQQVHARAVWLAVLHHGRLASWAAASRLSSTQARLAGCLLLLQQDADNASFHMPANALWGKLLGAARETVSRAVSSLEARSCFERSGSQVRVDQGACRKLLKSNV